MRQLSRFKPTSNFLVPITLFCSWSFLPLPVTAQDAEKEKEKSATLPEIKVTTGRVRPGTLEDVARTGSKTDTPLRDIPATVNVVPESDTPTSASTPPATSKTWWWTTRAAPTWATSAST